MEKVDLKKVIRPAKVTGTLVLVTDADLAAKSSHLRTSGPPTWPTRRSWPTGCTEDPSCRTADLTQVRSEPPTCRRTPHHQDGRHGERCGGMVKGAAACIRPPTPSPESPLIRTSSTLCRSDCEAGGLAHTGLDQQRLAQHI
ncbi:hypothetical protein BHE74_00027711 [Ensete ventricosum]|nr:hypothetical protein BHE74_00027711 [Ensete ventricosum]